MDFDGHKGYKFGLGNRAVSGCRPLDPPDPLPRASPPTMKFGDSQRTRDVHFILCTARANSSACMPEHSSVGGTTVRALEYELCEFIQRC